MMPLSTFLFLSMGIFAINGMLRGWYRELLGMFGIISGYFLIWFLSSQTTFFKNLSLHDQCLAKCVILIVMLFFGYHVPRWRQPHRDISAAGSVVLGGILGAINGYLVVGSLWYYLDAANYPWKVVVAPNDALSMKILQHYLPNVFFADTKLLLGVVLFILILILVEII